MNDTPSPARTARLMLQIVPLLVTVVAMGWLLANLSAPLSLPESAWSILLAAALAPLSGVLARVLLRGNRPEQAAVLVLGTHLMLTLLIVGQWGGRPGYEFLPYTTVVVVLFAALVADLLPVAARRRPLAAPATWLLLGAGTPPALLLLTGPAAATPGVWAPALMVSGLAALFCYVQETGRWRTAQRLQAAEQREQAARDAVRAATEALDLSETGLDLLQEDLQGARREIEEERELRLRFMENVSQELRTPLNAIVNFATVIARGGVGPVTERQVDYVERIERAGWHLLEVLDDVLDLARAEGGELQLEQELVDLQLICDEALAATRGLIMGKPVELIREFPEAIPPVYADPIRLRQVVINLLGNAARYTDQGYVALRVRPREHTVEIVIEDTGVGLRTEQTPKVTPLPGGGAGVRPRRRAGVELGLPLTRQLVERHGGTVAIHSAPDDGSVFTITLPLPRTVPAHDPAPALTVA